jgi:hypothetical protein
MNATAPTLMSLWLAHRAECRPIGAIVADARAGALPGVRIVSKHRAQLVEVTDETAALSAMLKD